MVNENVGIIAFAFGQDGEHGFPKSGPANDAVVQRAEQIRTIERAKGNRVLLAVQWEGACSQWLDHGQPSDNVQVSAFGPHGHSPTHYVTTEQVLNESLWAFRNQGVTRIILVAQAFHLFAINHVLKSDDWEHKLAEFDRDRQYDRRRGLTRIPYDTSSGNTQGWTRGPIRFGAYLGKLAVGGAHGS